MSKESSSGSGNEEGGSLAGKLSATVLSIILSFFSPLVGLVDETVFRVALLI